MDLSAWQRAASWGFIALCLAGLAALYGPLVRMLAGLIATPGATSLRTPSHEALLREALYQRRIHPGRPLRLEIIYAAGRALDKTALAQAERYQKCL
jgi:hypothetical protein